MQSASLLEYKVQFTRKLSQSILTASILVLSVLLPSSFTSTIFIHKTAYAQSSNMNTGFGETTNLALPNGKSIPTKYVINTALTVI